MDWIGGTPNCCHSDISNRSIDHLESSLGYYSIIIKDLPRSHPIYLNTNLLPTSVKAKKILDDLPGRCYEMYRIAVKISHDDLSQLSNVRKSFGLREEWDDCISSRKEAWGRCQLLHGGIPPSAISGPWVGEK
jgi:hypothetical protein